MKTLVTVLRPRFQGGYEYDQILIDKDKSLAPTIQIAKKLKNRVQLLENRFIDNTGNKNGGYLVTTKFIDAGGEVVSSGVTELI